MKVDNVEKEIRKQCEAVAEMIYERFIDTAENQTWLKRDTEKVGKVEVSVKPQQVKRWIAEQMRIVARPALNVIQQIRNEKCKWTLGYPEINVWETECDNAHQFFVDGPKENKYKYCPYCGKRIDIKE